MKFFLLISFCGIYLISQNRTEAQISSISPSQETLCDLSGIHSELLKAVNMLKKKAEIQKNYSVEKQSLLLRQDDDDDDGIPYYVPAIAKVVASVLARNVTSIIAESFGFIPPDVNYNIQKVIGLIADQVTKLNPALVPPTKAPSSTITATVISQESFNNGTNSTVLEIEQLLAYLIAEKLANITDDLTLTITPSSLASTSLPFKDTPQENVEPYVSKITPENEPLSIAAKVISEETISTGSVSISELFSTTFKYTKGQSVINTADELNVYNYAPSFGVVTTTNTPIYAPAFDHNTYPFTTSKPPTTTTESKDAVVVSAINAIEESSTQDTASSTTNEDDDDYEEAVTVIEEAVTLAQGTQTNSSTPTTDIDEDGDGDEYDDSRIGA